LFQRVLFVAHADGTTWGIVDHDRMTVIDHVQRRRLVVEPNGWQIGLLGGCESQWGTGGVRPCRAQMPVSDRPVVGALVSVVAPVAGFMLLGGRKRGGQ
jgi:hypothetical protein